MRIPHSFLGILVATFFALATPAFANPINLMNWPDRETLDGRRGALVTYPSHSPFTLWEVGKGETVDPPTDARAALFLPENASADAPVPAVVLLHGAAGVLGRAS